MASENDKGKGKQKEIDEEASLQTKSWLGRLHDGKWFCECDRKANCLTVKDVSKRTYGDKYWACSRVNPNKCKFFLWDLDQEQAREWHMKYGPQPPAPETPKPDEPASDEPSEDLGNPWTKSITKRKPVSREVSDEDETGGPSNQNVEVVELAPFRDLHPSRKAVKTTRFATPGQADRSKNAEDALPTPDTGPQALASGSRSRLSRAGSAPPQLSDAIIMKNERKSSLSAEVLKLIRTEKVGLKESVEIQIEHEIDTEVALYEQKLRGYEKTNKKLSRRLDEMESMVVLLGGDVAADDSVEFSE